MKVAYDISVLGLGALHARSRTGVFRVVENLAAGLAASPGCELRLCAGGSSFHAVYGAFRYLEEHPALAGVPFVSGGPRARLSRRLVDAFAARIEAPAESAPARLLRRAAGRGCEWVANRPHPIGPDALDGVDVFHSPHAPLPSLPRGAAGPRRFLTVYDLIAISRPELFEPHVAPYVREIVGSITPDDWVACISEATRADLCEHAGIDPRRVFVTPLAASRELFHPCADPARAAEVRARYGIPEGPYLLSLNTLEPRKNLGASVRAFARLVREEDVGDLRFVLVGTRGWDYASLFELVERCGPARDRIVFAGYVADEDLAALYSGALAFAYPSLYEGFGLPALEAMQCGVPVVASNTSSLPEVVGDAGILVDPLDEDALADALLRLYRDEGLRAELAARSLRRAELFSWERCTAETLAAYRTALDA